MAGPTSPIARAIDRIYRHQRDVRTGVVATYIPELAKVEPDHFGITLAMADGYVYEVGDASIEFTIQSISKAIVYGLALKDNGINGVLTRVGVAPSGDAFNAIEFDNVRGRPFNPMVNAGAIVTTSLIGGRSAEERFSRILDLFHILAGRRLEINEAVYRSEKASGHRNRAIAYLELSAGMIDGDIEQHLDVYFRQCSILVTARDLAMIAATLASGGVNPSTGVRGLPADLVRHVLSVMTSCGMYDYSGEWEFEVGLPAKSGVGGGVMAVLPGELGIGIFSPRLDEYGNSLRGVGVCREMASQLKLHMLEPRSIVRTPIRRVYRGDQVQSKRTRRKLARQTLDRLARGIVVFELQGDLNFAGMEALIRGVISALAGASHIILDFQRVSSINSVAHRMLAELRHTVAAASSSVIIIPMHGTSAPPSLEDAHLAADIDSALERAETQLLRASGLAIDDSAAVAELAEFEFLYEFEHGEIETLRRYLARAELAQGAMVIAAGDKADSIYFLIEGIVEARIGGDYGEGAVRLGAIEAGNVFGEVALLGDSRRTADVITRTPVELLVLTAEAAETLFRDAAAVHRKLLLAVGRSLSERLRRANVEIRAHAPERATGNVGKVFRRTVTAP